VFEMTCGKGSPHITKTLVLAMQFSRSAPRLRSLKAAVRMRRSSRTNTLGSTAGCARAARNDPVGIAPSKQNSECPASPGSGGAGAGPAAEAAGGDIQGRMEP
jgi:hypothetical protein